jgi:ferrous iron transport protein B
MIVAGLFLHHFFFENEHVPFIMELPLYHVPNLRTIGIYTWENILGFLKKAGTTILIATMIIWSLSYFPSANIEQSYLGMMGRFLEPVGSLMGLPWPLIVALLASIIAKENAIATLAVLYGSVAVLAASLPMAAALAFMVFLVLFIPCVGTVAAIRQETRSWKWTVGNIGMQLIISMSLAIVVYQVGRLF